MYNNIITNKTVHTIHCYSVINGYNLPPISFIPPGIDRSKLYTCRWDVVSGGGGGRKVCGWQLVHCLRGTDLTKMSEKNVSREFDYPPLLVFETEDPVRRRRLCVCGCVCVWVCVCVCV